MKISAADRLTASAPAWASPTVTLLKSFCTTAKYSEELDAVIGKVPKTSVISMSADVFAKLARICLKNDLQANIFTAGNALTLEITEM